MTEPLLIPHGGYQKLKTFQIARLIYDLTVLFCDRHIDRFNRMKDQMVQAARSGVQNIAEGSRVSGTSKKSEMKLTNVARASLDELNLDYEDFLRQRNLPVMGPDDPMLQRFKAQCCCTMDQVLDWIEQETAAIKSAADLKSSCRSVSAECLMANAALSLLNLERHMLRKQIESQADQFENEGGFTERLHRVRMNKRKQR